MPARRITKGFTLTELIVAIAIAAILTSMALPSMRDMVLKTRVKNLAFDLYADLAFARSEAIKRQVTVTLAADGAWSSGWSVTSGATVLRQHDAVSGGIAFSGNTSATFNALGRPQAAFSLDVSSPELTDPTDPNRARCISLELSGRPKSTSGNC